MIVNDEGDIYCFPFIRGDNSLMVFQGPIVRKDWLDKLGIPMPETIDDWYAMLQAFRDKDPNGNGKKDEVPFTTMLYGHPAGQLQVWPQRIHRRLGHHLGLLPGRRQGEVRPAGSAVQRFPDCDGEVV